MSSVIDELAEFAPYVFRIEGNKIFLSEYKETPIAEGEVEVTYQGWDLKIFSTRGTKLQYPIELKYDPAMRRLTATRITEEEPFSPDQIAVPPNNTVTIHFGHTASDWYIAVEEKPFKVPLVPPLSTKDFLRELLKGFIKGSERIAITNVKLKYEYNEFSGYITLEFKNYRVKITVRYNNYPTEVKIEDLDTGTSHVYTIGNSYSDDFQYYPVFVVVDNVLVMEFKKSPETSELKMLAPSSKILTPEEVKKIMPSGRVLTPSEIKVIARILRDYPVVSGYIKLPTSDFRAKVTENGWKYEFPAVYEFMVPGTPGGVSRGYAYFNHFVIENNIVSKSLTITTADGTFKFLYNDYIPVMFISNPAVLGNVFGVIKSQPFPLKPTPAFEIEEKILDGLATGNAKVVLNNVEIEHVPPDLFVTIRGMGKPTIKISYDKVIVDGSAYPITDHKPKIVIVNNYAVIEF